MTLGQINLWRYCVKEAGCEAILERRPVSTYYHPRAVLFHEVRIQMARAYFCAKRYGFEFSELKR